MEESKDRISEYLTPRVREMIFGELSLDYLTRAGADDILTGVPVPVREKDEGEGVDLDMRDVVEDMARVIGADPHFVFAEQYADFIKLAAGGSADAAARILVSSGASSADDGDFEDACMLLRAALRLEPKSRDALYLYARACKEIYESEPLAALDGMGDEGRIGMFKAESMESFELLTMIHPDFALGYYFLGYAYLNMGLYLKARLTWQEFLDKSSGSVLDSEEMDDDMLAAIREEVSERGEELEEPVEIEKGCNLVMSGDFQGGKELLDKYKEGRNSEWWPLWYYLASAESGLGNKEDAIECYKKVLKLNPSNTDVMEELAAIYAVSGDEENAAKYRNKIKLVRENQKAEAQTVQD